VVVLSIDTRPRRSPTCLIHPALCGYNAAIQQASSQRTAQVWTCSDVLPSRPDLSGDLNDASDVAIFAISCVRRAGEPRPPHQTMIYILKAMAVAEAGRIWAVVINGRSVYDQISRCRDDAVSWSQTRFYYCFATVVTVRLLVNSTPR